MIKDDTEVLVVCSPEDAEYIIKHDKDKAMLNNLIITSVVPIGEVTVVPKNEFLYYLEHGCSDFEED